MPKENDSSKTISKENERKEDQKMNLRILVNAYNCDYERQANHPCLRHSML